MGITWEEAEVAAQNRSEWRQSVAQCIHLDMCWNQVQVHHNIEVFLDTLNFIVLPQC